MQTCARKRKLLESNSGMRVVALWALFVGLASLSSRATEISVSTAADIGPAVALAQPGDTIVMRDGTWPDADILFVANGTATKPITLRAQTLGRDPFCEAEITSVPVAS